MQEAKKSRSYKDLDVWKLAISLVRDIYQTTDRFPALENYGLSQQLRKAAVSIPSNIAEGQFRNSSKEFKQFISIALGSSAELETQLIIANEIGYLTNDRFSSLSETLERILKMLRKLYLSLK